MSRLCPTRASTRRTQVNCLLSSKKPYEDHLCLFCALALCMSGHNDLDSHISKYLLFNLYQISSGSLNISWSFFRKPTCCRRNYTKRHLYPRFRNATRVIFERELARRSIKSFDKRTKLLGFHNHIIHTNDTDSFLKCFHCPSCDTFFHKSDHLNKLFLRCKVRV